MALFSKENRVKCGRCNTDFDIQKNNQCPLCGFGKHLFSKTEVSEMIRNSLDAQDHNRQDYLAIPPTLKLSSGKLILDNESTSVGLWGMINDFFSGKALLRINANLINKNKKDYISLFDLIECAKETIHSNKLTKLKGFPNDIDVDSSVGRLVYHFIDGFYKMGLFEAKSDKKLDNERLWNQDWKNILIRPTEEGLAFAQIPNKVFDEKNHEDQTLTDAEKDWLIDYLKNIDKRGFKEYTLLKEITSFIKNGKNGNKDLWGWFKRNESFISYVKEWSGKKNDPKAFEKQLNSLAQTFSSGKISLLREIGIIKNKRNDYTVVGEL